MTDDLEHQTPEQKKQTLLEQKAKAQQFSLNMFGHVANAATIHFLGMAERQLKEKEEELRADVSKTKEDIIKELEDFGAVLARNTHLFIRSHTAFIVGGLTQDMFPQIYPKPEESKSVEFDVVKDPEPISIGINPIPSEERILG